MSRTGIPDYQTTELSLDCLCFLVSATSCGVLLYRDCICLSCCTVHTARRLLLFCALCMLACIFAKLCYYRMVLPNPVPWYHFVPLWLVNLIITIPSPQSHFIPSRVLDGLMISFPHFVHLSIAYLLAISSPYIVYLFYFKNITPVFFGALYI